MKKYFLFALFCLPSFTYAAHELEIISLKHRTVEQVLPLIQPLLSNGEVASGMNNQLILRASPEHLQQLRQVLQQIDVAPKRLMVTVLHDVDSKTAEKLRQVSGQVVLGRQSSVQLDANLQDRNQQQTRHQQQQVQVLEGNRALIRGGRINPVPQRQVIRNRYGVNVIDSVSYQDQTSGFYVLPRVNGQQVTLDIYAQDHTNQNHTNDVQQLSSTVSGRIGEWINLGGAEFSQQQQQSGILSQSEQSNQQQRQILLRVELVE